MNEINTIHSGMEDGHFLSSTTCNTCHDPHGFSGGNPAHNNYMINLIADDQNYLGPNRNGETHIELDQGGGGTCNFVCHADSYEHTGSGYTK